MSCSERTIMKLSIPIAALLLGVATSVGAQHVDPRWTPFVGCWALVDGGADIYVVPAAPGAVTLSTRVEGEPVFEQTIVADGASHALSEAGCTGLQRAEWSRDGRRLFARADLKCANQPPRTVTGLAFMTGENGWLEVQAIEIATTPPCACGGTAARQARARAPTSPSRRTSARRGSRLTM